MKRRLTTLLIAMTLLTAPASFAAQDELMEKINRLEQQIRELKLLKEQQQVTVLKEEQCVRAVGRDKFCKCVAESLPRTMSFDQYVHTIVTPKDKLGYDSMSTEQKTSIDTAIAAREKCVEKGFFK